MLQIALPYCIIHKTRTIRKIIRRQINRKITGTQLADKTCRNERERLYISFTLECEEPKCSNSFVGSTKSVLVAWSLNTNVKINTLKLLDNFNSLGKNRNMTDFHSCGYMMCTQLKWKVTNTFSRFSCRKMEWDLKRQGYASHLIFSVSQGNWFDR